MMKSGTSEHLESPPWHSSRKQLKRQLKRGKKRTRRARKIKNIAPTVGAMGTKSIIASSYGTKRRRPPKPRKLQLQPQWRPPPQPLAKHHPPTTPVMQQPRRILQK